MHAPGVDLSPSDHRSAVRQEWATMWPLPVVAMLGLSGVAMFAFSSGVFMEPMTRAFGWTRLQFSTAFSLQMVLGLFLLPAIGWLIDRIGPRRVALIGLGPFVAAFAWLGTANGSIMQWWLLCLLLAVTQGFVTQTVWVTPVATRFHASRGLALAITLSGLGLGSLIWPILSVFYIGAFGWRGAFPALAASWGVVVVPLVLIAFHGPRRTINAMARPPWRRYGAALCSRSFVGLVAAGGLFACAYYGMLVHLVPILRGGGLSQTAAAAIGGMTGLFSIVGRLGTGWLLDRLPVRTIGAVVFALPVVVAGLLLSVPGSLPVAMVAVALLGLSSGAEMDIITFIAARRFGQEVFGSVYGIFTALLALCASAGPLLGGGLFDLGGSYTPFLFAIMPIALICVALILWIPIKPSEDLPPACHPTPGTCR